MDTTTGCTCTSQLAFSINLKRAVIGLSRCYFLLCHPHAYQILLFQVFLSGFAFRRSTGSISAIYLLSTVEKKQFLNTHQMTISRNINKQLRILESISSDVGGTNGINAQIETNNDCREWTLSKQLDAIFYLRNNFSLL